MNRIMRKIVLWICLLVTSVLYAQETSLSVKLSQGHPRYLTDSNGKVETQKLIKEEPWAQEVFEKLKQRTDRYADRGPEWLTSRLQMYWKTHATEVYIKENIMIMQEERGAGSYGDVYRCTQSCN